MALPILETNDPKVQQYAGRKFGMLTAESFVESAKGKNIRGQMWVFRCSCGKEVIRRMASVKRGSLISCGCQGQIGPMKHGHTAYGRKVPIYQLWQNVMSRCYQKSNSHYENYGGRGITVCERWKDFRNFLDDMGHRPPGLTLERKYNDAPY